MINRNFIYKSILILLILLTTNTFSQETLSEHFEPLKPFLGKTWKGIVAENENKEPVYDVSRWERILNGKAVRILHSVNEGDYGGETIIVWDKEKESLVFYYFTTASHYTQGTVKFDKGKMISHEKVTGIKDGVTEVEAASELNDDGTMKVTSRFKKQGEWSANRTVIYFEDQEAEVIFK